MKEDDGFPLFIAPLGIVEPRTRAEAGGGGELGAVQMGYRSPFFRPGLADESYAA